MLYLIEILHQTTTTPSLWLTSLLLYLIEILHQTTTSAYSGFAVECCILSKFYIKPQRNRRYFDKKNRCILSKFYIKPQLCLTSFPGDPTALYLIEILHQTTTRRTEVESLSWLYLIEILHQTTTVLPFLVILLRCILSKFYIKPQLRLERELAYCSCILSKFYIKPQHPRRHRPTAESCILSKFYIKPQLRCSCNCSTCVVSYRNSTSNHNVRGACAVVVGLYLIEILHQTTTRASTCVLPSCCILSKFYIKPQHGSIRTYNWGSCILSKFYIKPQLRQGLYSAYKGCILSKFYIKPQQCEKQS